MRETHELPEATRHRILIAAAVTAAVGKARITDIRRAAWTRRNPPNVRSAPKVDRRISPVEMEPLQEEEVMS